jgi:TRAP-type mannitol/chloroaromatic compound transport system permease large subunit
VAEPLHWATVALVVSPFGTHLIVLPLPVADPMHWLTVTPAVDLPTTTLLVTVTLQITLLPPPLTIPLHWLTDVTSWVDLVTVLTGTVFSGQEG